MEREVNKICKEKGIKTISKPTIYKYWNPSRKKLEEELEKQKPKKIFNPVNFVVIHEDFDPIYKKLDQEIERLRNSTFKKLVSIASGKFLEYHRLRSERSRETHEDANRRFHWLEKMIKVEIKPSKQSSFFEINNYNDITELVTRMFYPYFFGLGINGKPEIIEPITFEIKFNPLEGTINFLEEEIQAIETLLAWGHTVRGVDPELERLKRDHIEHYRLTAIKNKNFNREYFENFKESIEDYVKTRVLQAFEREKKKFRFPSSWGEILKKKLEKIGE